MKNDFPTPAVFKSMFPLVCHLLHMHGMSRIYIANAVDAPHAKALMLLIDLVNRNGYMNTSGHPTPTNNEKAMMRRFAKDNPIMQELIRSLKGTDNSHYVLFSNALDPDRLTANIIRQDPDMQAINTSDCKWHR